MRYSRFYKVKKVCAFIVLGWCFIIQESYSQTPANVSTPKSSSVTAYITSENTNYWRGYYDAFYATNGRYYLYQFSDGFSSSMRFNCHGFAWHMDEGGSPRWIGYYVSTDEDIYMTDGSYVQVCNEMYPGKVSWNSDNHSAATTPTVGRFISKWGQAPLLEHAWNDTPYNNSSLKYYVSTDISGSASELCSGTRTLTAQNIPGAIYTWSINTRLLSIVSGQGTNQLIVQRNGTGSGQGWVEVQISTPCSSGSVSSKKFNFWIGAPHNAGYITGSTYTYELTYTSYSISPVGGTQYNWQFPNGWSGGGVLSTPLAFTTVGVNSGYVYVTPHNSCGSGSSSNTYVTVVPCQYCRTVDISPNPANDYLSIVPRTSSLEGDQVSLELVSYYIVDIRGRLVAKKEGKFNVDPHTIEVSGLSKGLYIIHLLMGDGEKITKRLLIDR
jgi:hypothetical protein